MEKFVEYPDHVRAGIRSNHRAHPLPVNLRLFGADTETVRGAPHTVQVFDGESPVQLAYVGKGSVFPVFWAFVRETMRTGGVNVCYFHHLKFDLMVLFADHHMEIYEQGGASEFFVESDGRPLRKKIAAEPGRTVVHVEILFGKVNAATLTEGNHFMEDGELRFEGKTILKVYDSLAFTQASLARSLKMFKIPQSKLSAPEGLGVSALKTPEFEAYAKQDVVAQWHLGKKILDIHEKYKVRPSISLPQFMSRVFRHDFFCGEDKMEFPPLDVVRASELSYHGGKGKLYAPPGVYEDVTEVDINSAYPWAMRGLPSFLKGKFRAVDDWAGPGLVGVYKISGWTDPKTVYPLVFDHKFRRVDGSFEDLWNTSFEVEKMLTAPFMRVTKISGYVWEPAVGAGNPFLEFVDHFYKLKEETARDDPYYNFYKIALNALYGKLVGVVEDRELIELEDQDESSAAKVKLDFKWDSVLGRYVKTVVRNRAGQMYNPFIATLITGRVRAFLYDLETKYGALHSATDSIKTLKRIKGVPGLGGWKEEVTGRCYLFRNKLYLHFTSKDPVDHAFAPGPDKECSGCGKAAYKHIRENGQSLEKVALHGYKGTIQDLFDNRFSLLKEGKMSYEFQHVVGLREGLRRKETPADFVMRRETLALGGVHAL